MTPAHNPDFKGEKMKKKVPAPKGRRSAAPMKSPIAEAWAKWIAGDGASLTLSHTLGTTIPNVYLTNRLWTAFMAGASAAAGIALEVSPPKSPKGRGK